MGSQWWHEERECTRVNKGTGWGNFCCCLIGLIICNDSFRLNGQFVFDWFNCTGAKKIALQCYRNNTFPCCIILVSLYLNVQVQNTLQITCAFFCSSANVNNSLYYKRVVGNGVCYSVIRSRINRKEWITSLMALIVIEFTIRSFSSIKEYLEMYLKRISKPLIVHQFVQLCYNIFAMHYSIWRMGRDDDRIVAITNLK